MLSKMINDKRNFVVEIVVTQTMAINNIVA